MSWIRFGGTCEGVGSACSHQPDGECPGSSVYVFDNSDGYVECCACPLVRPSPWLKSADEMYEHLRAHAAAGHHVPMRYLSAEADAAAGEALNAADDQLNRAAAKGDPDGLLKPAAGVFANLAEFLAPDLDKPLFPKASK